MRLTSLLWFQGYFTDGVPIRNTQSYCRLQFGILVQCLLYFVWMHRKHVIVFCSSLHIIDYFLKTMFIYYSMMRSLYFLHVGAFNVDILYCSSSTRLSLTIALHRSMMSILFTHTPIAHELMGPCNLFTCPCHFHHYTLLPTFLTDHSQVFLLTGMR